MEKRVRGPRTLVVRIVILVVGVVLLALGIAGLAIPIVPGWALIFAGLAVLAQEFVWARNLRDHAKKRWQRLRAGATGGGDPGNNEKAA